jgi:hypothetical protein
MVPVVMLIIGIMTIFFYFFLIYLINFYIELNYKLHNYTPPPPPKFRIHCPPPPAQYYLNREFLHTQKNKNTTYHPNIINDDGEIR